MGKIEHAVAKLGFAMVTFADIKSAFDYARNQNVLNKMKDRECRESSIN